jgi:hypothetical protein
MIRTQVGITALGAARLYRGLFDFPVLNSPAKVVSDPERANELNREVTEVVSPCSHQPRHDAEGGSVVLDIRRVSTSGSEVHTVEGGNIV